MGLPETKPGLHLITEPAREPICNVEAEEAVIGALLIDPDAFIRVSSILKPEHFYSTALKTIYYAVETLEAQGKRSDMVTVVSQLQELSQLEKVGGQRRIAQLLESLVSTANVDLYAELVREKWVRRQMLLLGSEVQLLARQPGSPPELIATVRDRLDQLTNAEPGQWKDMPALRDELQAHSQNMIDGKQQPGIAWGFCDLDRQLQGGSAPGTLLFLAGRPGMGKTALMLNAAVNSAETTPTGIFSMEMKSLPLTQRILAMRSGLWLSAIQSMNMQEQDYHRFHAGLAALDKVPNLFVREARLSVDELCNEARVAVARYGLKSIWIDHLHEFPGAEDTTELTRICNRLKDLAFNTGITVNLLAQLSRGVESRTNKRPMLSDLRQSGKVEEVAEKVVMLYRDEYYNPDSPDRGVAEVHIVKHRNGPVGTVKLLFEPQFSRFRSLARIS